MQKIAKTFNKTNTKLYFLMLRKITHTDGSIVILDTSEGVYYRLPDTVLSLFDKSTDANFCNNIEEFIRSEYTDSFVPVFVMNREPEKRRYYIRIVSGMQTYKIYNVERILNKWVANNIDDTRALIGFIFDLSKDNRSDNGFIVNNVKLLKNPAG